MRFASAHEQRRDDLYVAAREAFIVSRFGQRAVEAGRFHFERIRLVERLQTRVDCGCDSLTRLHVDAALTVDRHAEHTLVSAAARSVVYDLHARKTIVARDLGDRVLEFAGE